MKFQRFFEQDIFHGAHVRFACLVACNGLFVACAPPSSNSLVNEEGAILREQDSAYELYYKGELAVASKSLRDYIQYLARYGNDSGVKGVCLTGKAMALARLEFIENYQDSKAFDFNGAIDAFAVYDESVPRLNRNRLNAL
jgi:hypothetical protein